MSNRLTQIPTRTGDDGTPGLGDGSRVAKDHSRMQALGDVEVLNSTLRVPAELPRGRARALVVLQHELFNLGASGRCQIRVRVAEG